MPPNLMAMLRFPTGLLGVLVAALSAGQTSGTAPRSRASSQTPRFERQYPLPGLTGIMLDRELHAQGIAIPACRALRLQARILWIDCTANIDRFNTEAKIASLMDQVKDAGFNTVAFDVKPISGHVVYPSKIAPKLLDWKGKKIPADFDPLAVMVRETKRVGLTLFASLNAFSEGHRDLKIGPGYMHPEQQSVLYEPQPIVVLEGARYRISPQSNVKPQDNTLGGFSDASKIPPPGYGQFAVTITRDGMVLDGYENGGESGRVPPVPIGGCVLWGAGKSAEWLRGNAMPGAVAAFEDSPQFVASADRPEQQIPLMMNPNDPRVRTRALAILKEVVANYAVDGALYDDRLRYAGANADFSAISRKGFEAYVGKKLSWPDDVFRYRYGYNLVRGVTPGPYYQAWLNWRAWTLQDFVAKARSTVVATRPTALFGLYAGSWYGEYASFGSNYASPDFEAGFWYLTDEYRRTGFAPSLDFLITGCYYQTSTIYEAMQSNMPYGATIESAGYLSSRAVRDMTWTYAGISLSHYKGNPGGLQNALQAACGSTCGVMVFDLSHDIDPMWPVFKQAFSLPMKPPHSNLKALDEVRKKRAVYDKARTKSPPVIVSSGQPGAGH
jgi:hypothetical protein